MTRRSRLGQRLQDRARPGGEKDRVRPACSPGRVHVRDRLRFGRGRRRAEGRRRSSVFENGSAVAAAVRRRPARSASSGGSARSGSATWSGAGARRSAPLRAADARIGRRPARRDDKRTAPRGAHAARRTGPADQPAAGRRAGRAYVSLYGEVQKEVIQATLAGRVRRRRRVRGDDADLHRAPDRRRQRRRDRWATLTIRSSPTVGLPIEPAPARTRSRSRSTCGRSRCTSSRRVEEFRDSIETTVRATLEQGLYGWQVTDWK